MTMKNLLISFSGGETSAYMTQWILNNWQEEFDNIEVVFANTGEEHEETLSFVHKCDEMFGFNTTWVEAEVRVGVKNKLNNDDRIVVSSDHFFDYKDKLDKDLFTTFPIGTTHKVVGFETASRDGEPFEQVIKKYGIPNPAFPHCTRELKTNPIKSYVKNDLGWSDYYTAIGIRADEFDRIDPKYEEKKFLYPLCKENPTTKQHVNYFWDGMPFRVELKGYEGNCKACWKKSLRKLLTIAKNNPEDFNNMKKWEHKYDNFTPGGRSNPNPPYRFYRDNLSVCEIMQMAREGDFKEATDDRTDTSYQPSLFGHELDKLSSCGEHCEPF